MSTVSNHTFIMDQISELICRNCDGEGTNWAETDALDYPDLDNEEDRCAECGGSGWAHGQVFELKSVPQKEEK